MYGKFSLTNFSTQLQNFENSASQDEETKTCICRNKCLTDCVVYQAVMERTEGVTDSFVGLTANSFKDKWTKHKSSFRTRNPKNASGLSKIHLEFRGQKHWLQHSMENSEQSQTLRPWLWCLPFVHKRKILFNLQARNVNN